MDVSLRRIGGLVFGLALTFGVPVQAQGQGDRLNTPAPLSELRTGFYRGHIVTYRQAGNLKILEGDILLDRVDAMASMAGAGRGPNGIGTAGSNSLWPKVGGIYTIPYVVTAGSATNIKAAVNQFNTVFKGLLKFVPRASQHDYVNFDLTLPPNSSCYSYIGNVHFTGGQAINGGADCPVPSLLHEMGHAVGLYHEQSRTDRGSYVKFFLDNVIDGQESAYDQPTDNAQAIGLYDYGSIMHYYPYAFSRNKQLTMESIPAGIEFGVAPTYSAGDIDTIRRIYGAAPKTVTIVSVPSGAMVTVDGVATRTPKAFSWAMNSTHTLAVPAGAQTVAGQAYIYGRWSDSTAASHTITVKPGGGTPATPKASPANTVYTAAFIHLAPFQPQVSIIGAGTVTGVPAAKAYPGVSGLYYPVRLPVTYTAHPDTAHVFAGWFQPIPSGLNPVVGTSSDFVFAYVVDKGTPLTTIQTSPAGVDLLVDGAPALGPSLFAWTPGSSHTVSTVSPYGSPNTRSQLIGWSDKGPATHSVMATSASQTITAAVKLQYKPYLTADPQCAGTLTYAPASGDGFYTAGTALQVALKPSTGWFFAGWTQDLAKMANPAKFTLTAEIRGVAQFNTVAAPLKITSFSPASLAKGSSVATPLTVTGTGFTTSSALFVNGDYHQPTFVSATRLTFALKPADVAAANALNIEIQNVKSDTGCFVSDGRVFFITES